MYILMNTANKFSIALKNINVYWVTSFEYKYKLYSYFSKKKKQTNKNSKILIFWTQVFYWSKMSPFYFIMERDNWINVFVPMVMIKVDDLSQWWWLGLMLCLLISKFYIIQYRNCFWWGFFLFAVVFPLKLLNWSSLALKLPHFVISGAK